MEEPGCIRRVLMDELGVSAAAAGMMLKMEERINDLQEEVQKLRAELDQAPERN
jgi:hypothetical protein